MTGLLLYAMEFMAFYELKWDWTTPAIVILLMIVLLVVSLLIGFKKHQQIGLI
jgi:Mg2+ and Co2+ transporter CorA